MLPGCGLALGGNYTAWRLQSHKSRPRVLPALDEDIRLRVSLVLGSFVCRESLLLGLSRSHVFLHLLIPTPFHPTPKPSPLVLVIKTRAPSVHVSRHSTSIPLNEQSMSPGPENKILGEAYGCTKPGLGMLCLLLNQRLLDQNNHRAGLLSLPGREKLPSCRCFSFPGLG